MPWKRRSVVDEKVRFIEKYLERSTTMVELCEEFEISRATGYETVNRFKNEGLKGLTRRSSAPNSHSNQTSEEIVDLVVCLRRKRKTWGPKKIKKFLETRHKDKKFPSASTIGEILHRKGLVKSREKRRNRRLPVNQRKLAESNGPNDVWCADYKGEFRTRDSNLCYPLTISEYESRYLIRCVGMKRISLEQSKEVFISAFREYGMPLAMRTDNGIPFASTGLAGLTRLSVWWMRLGIKVDRIQPGCPQQNGRHERMHKTLKEDTILPPGANLRAQQRKFNRFRTDYNNIRPHEALEMKTPSEFFQPSSREYPKKLEEVSYPGHFVVRSIRRDGYMKFHGTLVFVSEALAGQPVGLEEETDGEWRIQFMDYTLAHYLVGSPGVTRYGNQGTRTGRHGPK